MGAGPSAQFIRCPRHGRHTCLDLDFLPCIRAAAPDDLLRFLPVFDPLGDNGKIKVSGKFNHRVDDPGVAGVAVHRRDKRPVDLYPVEMQLRRDFGPCSETGLFAKPAFKKSRCFPSADRAPNSADFRRYYTVRLNIDANIRCSLNEVAGWVSYFRIAMDGKAGPCKGRFLFFALPQVPNFAAAGSQVPPRCHAFKVSISQSFEKCNGGHLPL